MAPRGGDDGGAAAGTSDPPPRLFVYGSLRMGEENEMARLLHGHSRYLGPGTIRARMYAIDWCCGAVSSDDPADVVHGEVFELHAASAGEVMAALNAYEGDDYALREVAVALAGETSLPAHAYLFAASVAGLTCVPHGRWPRQARRTDESG
ncbi:MAG TPA: gamma-glutamylcyclotransferase family protein [Longimicrobium sp.]|jgi:gamma-glutamylcyclotransferase (GGCT)/AIG2-like uncharacterized protein YtfP